jgi:hypothetical protein
MPLIAGRDFSGQDVPGAEKVAVVNEALVSALFGDDRAIGQFVSYEEDMPADTRIVGIAKDAKSGPRTEARPTIYLPCFQQRGSVTMKVVARMTAATVGRQRASLLKPGSVGGLVGPRALGTTLPKACCAIACWQLSGFFAVCTVRRQSACLGSRTSVAGRMDRRRVAPGRRADDRGWSSGECCADAVGGAPARAYIAASRVVAVLLYLSATDPPMVAAAIVRASLTASCPSGARSSVRRARCGR